jgi:hypothetical protein
MMVRKTVIAQHSTHLMITLPKNRYLPLVFIVVTLIGYFSKEFDTSVRYFPCSRLDYLDNDALVDVRLQTDSKVRSHRLKQM